MVGQENYMEWKKKEKQWDYFKVKDETFDRVKPWIGIRTGVWVRVLDLRGI